MKKIFLSLSSMLLFTVYASAMQKLEFEKYTPDWEERASRNLNIELFNTKLIGDVPEIQRALTERYRFKKSSFMSNDGLKLECLQRIVPDAEFTMICGAGFFPGNMTGCSSIIPMLPKKCNIIMYNNRGTGNSEQPWFYKLRMLWRYGINEYNDALGALNYARDKSDKPIIMHSYCANALHTTKAIEHLHKIGTLQNYALAGLFLDSAVSHLPTAIENIPDYKCSPWNTIKGFCARLFLWTLRYTIFHRWSMPAGEKVCINTDVLTQTQIPTHHFYAQEGDLFTPYSMTHGLYEEQLVKAKDPDLATCTIFPKSSHANHILVWKKYYAGELQKYIISFLRQHRAKEQKA